MKKQARNRILFDPGTNREKNYRTKVRDFLSGLVGVNFGKAGGVNDHYNSNNKLHLAVRAVVFLRKELFYIAALLFAIVFALTKCF